MKIKQTSVFAITAIVAMLSALSIAGIPEATILCCPSQTLSLCPNDGS